MFFSISTVQLSCSYFRIIIVAPDKALFSIKMCRYFSYPIQPNYRTMHLGFSKSLGKLVVKYVSTCTKSTLKEDQPRTLTLLLLNMTCPVLANSVDPDQLPSEEAN